MSDSTLTEIYKGWETYQGYLIKAVAPLSDDQLALSTSPTLRTISKIALHLIAVRVRWFHNAAGAGKAEEYAAIGLWDRDGQPSRSAAELVSGLETTWRLIQEALASWTPADLETPFTRLWQGEEHSLTRQWIIWHVIEHDVHHGGEISLTLGSHGLTGLDV